MSHPSSSPRWILRRGDQMAVAALVALAMLFLPGWWFVHGGHRSTLVEIDRTKPLTARFEIDVNTADATEWMQVPGVGPKLAGRIIASREADGPFHQYEDLQRVRGIGAKTLEHLRPFLRPMDHTPETTEGVSAPTAGRPPAE